MATGHAFLQLLEEMDPEELEDFDPTDPNSYGANKKRVKWTAEEVLHHPFSPLPLFVSSTHQYPNFLFG